MGLAAWGSYGLLTNFMKAGNSVATIFSICTGCLVYFVLIIALRVICKEDLDLIPKGDKIAKILRIK
jgi:stage V sporulation protein B